MSEVAERIIHVSTLTHIHGNGMLSILNFIPFNLLRSCFVRHDSSYSLARSRAFWLKIDALVVQRSIYSFDAQRNERGKCDCCQNICTWTQRMWIRATESYEPLFGELIMAVRLKLDQSFNYSMEMVRTEESEYAEQTVRLDVDDADSLSRLIEHWKMPWNGKRHGCSQLIATICREHHLSIWRNIFRASNQTIYQSSTHTHANTSDFRLSILYFDGYRFAIVIIIILIIVVIRIACVQLVWRTGRSLLIVQISISVWLVRRAFNVMCQLIDQHQKIWYPVECNDREMRIQSNPIKTKFRNKNIRNFAPRSPPNRSRRDTHMLWSSTFMKLPAI